MQRKTLKHLDVSRQKSRVATDLKSDGVRLVETIPFFQGSTAESQMGGVILTTKMVPSLFEVLFSF